MSLKKKKKTIIELHVRVFKTSFGLERSLCVTYGLEVEEVPFVFLRLLLWVMYSFCAEPFCIFDLGLGLPRPSKELLIPIVFKNLI